MQCHWQCPVSIHWTSQIWPMVHDLIPGLACQASSDCHPLLSRLCHGPMPQGPLANLTNPLNATTTTHATVSRKWHVTYECQ